MPLIMDENRIQRFVGEINISPTLEVVRFRRRLSSANCEKQAWLSVGSNWKGKAQLFLSKQFCPFARMINWNKLERIIIFFSEGCNLNSCMIKLNMPKSV